MKWSVAGLLMLLAVVQAKLWLGQGGVRSVYEIKQEVDAQRQENQRLRERNAALTAEVFDLKQGMESIEERARNDMGMVKANETFYRIIPRNPSSDLP